MCSLSGLPAIVPKLLKDELGRLQQQIQILVHNHRILHHRLQQDPQNEVTERLLAQVEDHLATFSEEQSILLEKVRRFLRDIAEGKYETNKREDFLRAHTKGSEESANSSKVATPISSDDEVSDDESAESDGGGGGGGGGASSGDDEEEERRPYLEYFTASGPPGDRQPGHIEDYHIPCPSPEPSLESVSEEDLPDFALERLDDYSTHVTREVFMHSLELVSLEESQRWLALLEERRRRSLKRVASYIPEVSDKKLRYQSYLQNSLFSPPHLRKRKTTPTSSSRSSPYCPPPPERMGTRSHLLNQEKGVQ